MILGCTWFVQRFLKLSKLTGEGPPPLFAKRCNCGHLPIGWTVVSWRCQKLVQGLSDRGRPDRLISRSRRSDRFSRVAMAAMATRATNAVRDPCAALRGAITGRERAPSGGRAEPRPIAVDRPARSRAVAAIRGARSARPRCSACAGPTSIHRKISRHRAACAAAQQELARSARGCDWAERALSQRRRRVASDRAACRMVVALSCGIPRCNNR